jgi:ferric-dicitrate binding protein FerR (iron transport regulator)
MNLTEILKKFTSGRATKEEREEFFLLLEQGAFDELVNKDMIEVWASEAPASEEEKALLAMANERLRAIHDLGTAKVVPFEKKSSRVWMAAAAAIIIVVMAMVVLMKEKDFFRDTVAQQELKPSIYTGKQVVVLPDGTEVIMNEQSELRYDHTFGETTREISFKGEAYFDVKHDASKPFIVHTGKVSTTVLGTAFNINAYADQQEVKVTVVRGLVQVGDDKRIYGKIKPDEQIAVNTSSYDFVQTTTKAEESLKWKSNFLILADVTLEEAAKIIGNKFGVQIAFENAALKTCRFDGTFLNDETLNDVLTMMSTVVNMNYTKEGDTVTFRGNGCLVLP